MGAAMRARVPPKPKPVVVQTMKAPPGAIPQRMEAQRDQLKESKRQLRAQGFKGNELVQHPDIKKMQGKFDQMNRALQKGDTNFIRTTSFAAPQTNQLAATNMNGHRTTSFMIQPSSSGYVQSQAPRLGSISEHGAPTQYAAMQPTTYMQGPGAQRPVSFIQGAAAPAPQRVTSFVQGQTSFVQ